MIIGPYHFSDIMESIEELIQSKHHALANSQEGRSRDLTSLYLSAIKRGNDTLIEWLISINCPCDQSTVLRFAIQKGKIRIFKFLTGSEQHFLINDKVLCDVISRNDIELIKWSHQFAEDWVWQSSDVLKRAIACQNLNIVKFFVETPPHKSVIEVEYHFVEAIKQNNLEILEFLLRNTSKLNQSDHNKVCEACVVFGRVKILEWWFCLFAKQKPKQREEEFTNAASLCAANGHAEMLKWLFNNGWSRGCSVLEGAALYGHLECMKIGREYGCAWSSLVCTNATEQGHLDCLIYAKENGCFFTFENALFNAVRKNHLHIVVWLSEQEGCKIGHEEFRRAVAYGRLEILKFLIDRGGGGADEIPPIGELITIAKKEHEVEIIKYLERR